MHRVQADLELQTTKSGMMSVNRLHVRVEEVRLIEENISLFLRIP